MIFRPNSLSAAIATCSAFAGSIAMAQPSALTAPQPGAAKLEEVVVTAQKRVQSLQDTPISIAAFGESELEKKGIDNVADIGASVPNVNIIETADNTTAATIAIRGSVTVNPAITWEPTVGMYLDGVYVGKNVGSIFDVAELTRIEVLRGPQGTLYGKNTLAGAVNLITQKPSGQFGGKLSAGVGNYQRQTGYLTVDTPALDLGGLGEVMARFTTSYKTRDGFYDNEADPFGNDFITATIQGSTVTLPSSASKAPSTKDFSNLNSKVGRYDILWQASDRLELRYTYDYSDIDQTPGKPQLTYFNPDIPMGPGTFVPPELGDYLTGVNDNKDAISADAAGAEMSKSISRSFFATYDVGQLGALGNVTFKYIGNDRALHWDVQNDTDGVPLDLFRTMRDISYNQRSHEMQMLGQTDQLDYVLGLYYLKEDADNRNPIDFFSDYGFPTSHNGYGLENKSKAVFGQVEWRPEISGLERRLSVILGLRWTEETKQGFISHPQALPPFEVNDVEKTYTNTSPTFVVAWNFTDNIHAYAKVAEGWKAGGFNGEATTEAVYRDGYGAETLRSYELGVKSRLLEDRLQINAAAFYNQSDDQQVTIFKGDQAASSQVANAAEATMTGFELEVIALLTANLELGMSYGYLDAEYGAFMDGGKDVSDERDFAYTPQHTASAYADYTFLEQSWGTLSGRLDYQFVDEHVPFIDPAQNATSKINTYQLLNGRLTLSQVALADGQTLELSLWGKNILDKEYRVTTIPFGAWTVSYYGNPRTYGLDATYRF
jgi:iron complex outermembrane receptor protein